MNTTKKKISLIALLTALVLTLPACGRKAADPDESDSAAEITTNSAMQVSDLRTEALQAYYDMLSQEKYQNEDAEVMKTFFAVSDLNADGIPELLVNHTGNLMETDQYYTYENGAVTEIASDEDHWYSRSIGDLYLLPSRNTYAFFLEGPSGRDDDNNLNCMFSLNEYTIEDHQIRMINEVLWEICVSGSQKGTSKCTWNDQPCSYDEIINQYQLKVTDGEDDIEYEFSSQEYNGIDFLCNTEMNRKAVCIDSDPAIYALNTYHAILSGEDYQNPGGEDKIMGTHYAIADLNADGTPELMISEDSNMMSIYEWYTYDDKKGCAVKIDGIEFGSYGGLYTLPYRGTFAFFRGGPAYTDEEDGQNYMPYDLTEFSLDLEKLEIHAVSGGTWTINSDSGKLSPLDNDDSCFLNGKECSLEDLIEDFQLKTTKDDEYEYVQYNFPESDYIDLLPNTDAKRKTIITGAKSDHAEDADVDESEADETDEDTDSDTDDDMDA